MPEVLKLRRVWLGAVTAIALMATPASAAVTTTTITSPADNTNYEYDSTTADPSTQKFTVTGTSDGADGDVVEIRCYNGTSYNTGAVATVAAGGTFSTEVPLNNLADTACILRAVPQGASPDQAGLAAFTGPRVATGGWYVDRIGGGANTGTPYDYYASRPTSTAYADYLSYSACGLDYMWLYGPNMERGHELFYCNAYPWYRFNDARGGLQIDGKTAYDAYSAQRVDSSLPGFPTPTFSRSVDFITGNLTITERQPLVRCAPDSEYNNTGDGACTSFESVGVTVERTITQTNGGKRSQISDDYVSADGAAHTVDVVYEQDFQDKCCDDTFVAHFPWESADYKPYDDFDVVGPAPSSPATMYLKASREEAEGIDNPVGAITFNTSPNSFVWYGDDGGYDRFIRPVPAGGRVNITHVFSLEASTAAARAEAARTEDAFGTPSVAITSPGNGANVESQPITVTGTATDNGGVAELKVNGQTVAVGANGAWSTQVTLAEGANTITAVAKDAAGNVSQAQVVVGYKKPAVVVPARIKPKSLTLKLKPKRDRTAPYAFTATGKLTLPAGASPAACASARASIQSKVGSKTISTRRGKVSKTCTFKIKVSFKKRARLGKTGVVKVTPRFLGNALVAPKKGKAVTFRAG